MSFSEISLRFPLESMYAKRISSIVLVMSCFLVFASSPLCTSTQAQTKTPGLHTSANTNQASDKSAPPQGKASIDSPLPKESSNLPSSSGSNLPLPEAAKDKRGYLSRYEYIAAIIIALVSLISLSMQFFLLRQVPKLKAEDTLRTFGVTLIIMGSLLLIALGFDSIQIAPAMGLVGTIAGYLLARVGRKENENNE